MAEQKYSHEQKQAVLAAVDRGSTIRAAAIAVGVPPHTGYQWVKQAGLSTSRSSPRKYSDEFKQDAVALVRQGATQREVGRDLGVSKSALSKWVADADRRDAGLPAARDVTAAEDAQIRELIRRNRLLEQENEVLRRAAAYLSQIHITPPK